MKQKILFSIVMAASITGFSQTEKKLTGYAITGPQYGQGNWKSVRLIDMTTGEEVKTIYSADMPEPQILNARTGKPVIKKDVANTATDMKASNIRIVLGGKNPGDATTVYNFNSMDELKASKAFAGLTATEPATGATNTTTNTATKLTLADIKSVTIDRDQNDYGYHRGMMSGRGYHQFGGRFETGTDAPFATTSSALAYDKKHERLYYTLMGFNQLRYIDLKSKTPTVYYFEDEPFGTVTSQWDDGNQITRMVIAADGNGYGLSNNNEHLMRFTTGKKPVITDLGAITDDAANGDFSISNGRRGYGGDLIADADANLYLITQNRRIYKISLETKVATYQGTIEGLPYNYSTNGVMVAEGSKIIVGSSGSDEGYYQVDMNTLQAEKMPTSGSVFKISDLASGNLLFEKKESKEEIMPVLAYQAKAIPADAANSIAVYPNPVFDRTVNLSFANQPAGDYKVQLMELSGKVISERNVSVNSKVQLVQFSLPQSMAKGSYLVKTTSDTNKMGVITKLVVE